MLIKDHGDLVLNAAVDASQTIAFSTNTGTLTIGTLGATAASAIGGFAPLAITGFLDGDSIVVQTPAAATFSLSGSVVSVIANAATLGVLTFDTLANAAMAMSSAGGLVDQVACFAAGTRIDIESGQMAVERLRPGDVVRTMLGGGWPGRLDWLPDR